MPVAAPDAAFDELKRLYAALDTELAARAAACRRCGQCCNFIENDYVLFASWLERELIRRETDTPPRLDADGSCPWQTDGLCSIHHVRPLGCRTAFCAPDWAPVQTELHERYRQGLAAITQRHSLPWDYARVLA